MFKKKFIFACALLLQGSGFCVLPEAFVPVELASTDAGFKFSYCRVSALTQPVDQTILVSRTDYAFLIKQFQAPQSAGVVNASKLRFIRQFVMAVKKRQSTQILLRCPFDEKMSFIVQLRFGVKAPGAKKTSTDVTIYGLWPTISQQIFEFVKTSVEQKIVWSVADKVVAVGGVFGGFLGFRALVNSVRDARLQREKKAAQDLEDAWHRTNCCLGVCLRRDHNLRCNGYGETVSALWLQRQQERMVAHHNDYCRYGNCRSFGGLRCNGWGELNAALWPQRAEERERAAAEANKLLHRQYCQDNLCRFYGSFYCDGFGETDPDLWPQKKEQRRLAKASRAQQKHRDRCRNDDCGKFGGLVCNGWGELNPCLSIEKAREQREQKAAAAAAERAEIAQRVSRVAQALQAAFADDKTVFITHSRVPARDEKISCFVYDLCHFNRDLVTANDTRVLVIGVSDLVKHGSNPVPGQGIKTVGDVILENVEEFKNRLWKIIIVNDQPTDGASSDTIKAAFVGDGEPEGLYVVSCDPDVPVADLVRFVRRQVPAIECRAPGENICIMCLNPHSWDSFLGSCRCPQKNTIGCSPCLLDSLKATRDDYRGYMVSMNRCGICNAANPVVVKFRHPGEPGAAGGAEVEEEEEEFDAAAMAKAQAAQAAALVAQRKAMAARRAAAAAAAAAVPKE